MVKVQITLQNGTDKVVEMESFNATEYEEKMNSRENFAIAIGGGVVVTKNAITMLSLVEDVAVDTTDTETTI
jgi:hypothetical protein